ncbi:hypothetical protein ACOJH2_004485 [Escherichia coli]
MCLTQIIPPYNARAEKKIRHEPEAMKVDNWWKFHHILLTSALNKNENHYQQMQVIRG